MKILALADMESKYFWEHYEPGMLEGIDLVLSAGDLKASYLDFIATFCRAPVLYVHGNHDEHYLKSPPEGCICVDDDVVTCRGLRIVGLGGSMWYHPGPFQYTEKAMRRRVRRLRFKLWRSGGFDLLLTHAPAKGINDGDDRPHKGFAAFCALMDRYRPDYMVHGHVHMTYGQVPRRAQYGDTQVINAFERYIFEIPDPPPRPDSKPSRKRRRYLRET